MNTTNNENAPTKEALNRDDKVMKDAYIKGETIDDIADTYGLAPSEVMAIVVNEDVDSGRPLQTQAEIDAQDYKGKE